MKAKELIYNLRTNLEQVGSSLTRATDQHIMYMLDEARAVLASRKMDQHVNVIQMSQHLDVIPRDATSEEMGTVGYSKLKVLEIPDPIAYLNGGGIFTIGPTDGRTSYTRITYSELRLIEGRKYTSKSPKWFFFQDKIFLVNIKPPGVKLARVRGIFDEPYKVIIARGEYKKLDPFNWEYPLSMKDADSVYKIAIAGDLGWGDTSASVIQAKMQKEKKDNNVLSALNKLSNAKGK